MLWPPAQAVDMVEPWLDRLEGALGGRAKFELYTSGELMPGDLMLPAVQDGTIDFAQGFGPDTAAPIDIIDFEGLPAFAWNSPEEVMTMFRYRGLEELYTAAYEELGDIKVLGWWTADPIHLMSTRPIEKFEDFDGLKINAGAAIAFPFVEAGAIPVYIPSEELFLAGETGVIDGFMWAGATEGYTNGWHEVFPYFLTNPINGGCNTFMIVNKDLWDGLPSDMQDIISMSMIELKDRSFYYYNNGEPTYRPYFKLTTMPAEDWNRFREIQMAHWDELAETSPRVAQVVQILKDYNAEMEAAKWKR